MTSLLLWWLYSMATPATAVARTTLLCKLARKMAIRGDLTSLGLPGDSAAERNCVVIPA